MEFSGFSDNDFDLFSIDDFAERMTEIRTSLKPKLIALAQDLTAPIEQATGVPTFPHVAQHLRRRVNPPVETWVAYAREKRGYKRWTHYRVAVSGKGVRVTVFIEDDADDKAPFGVLLMERGAELLDQLDAKAPVEWYTFGDDAPMLHSQVTPEVLRVKGSALQRLKTPKFQAGISLPRQTVLAMPPEGFEAWALEQVRVLKPLYLAGVNAGTPEA